MAERRAGNEGLKEKPDVHTSGREGRKYVDSNELIRTKKAQEQIRRLQKMFGSERAQH